MSRLIVVRPIFFFFSPDIFAVLNLYGTTEVSGDVTFQEFSSSTYEFWGRGGGDESIAPIGSPIPGNKVILMAPMGDSAVAEVPAGEVGEVFISGSHLSMVCVYSGIRLSSLLLWQHFATRVAGGFCSVLG